MPDIKEEDLLSLHRQIEEAEKKQTLLEELLSEKSSRLKKIDFTKKKLVLVCAGMVLLVISLTSYFSYADTNSNIREIRAEDFLTMGTTIDTLKNQLEDLKQEKINLEQIKDLYLFRSLIKKEKVYSVQMNSFTDQKVALFSEKFTNTRFYNDSLYYKFSLGIFETLPEAQEFRKFLISSGFDDRIFVISYKNGKRIRIENAE